MLECYKTSADDAICLAERMLTEAMAIREAANEALTRAADIAEAVAVVMDTRCQNASRRAGRYAVATEEEP